MSLDDVMIAMTLGGLFLSGGYIRACLRELRRERDYQMRQAERASILPRSRQTKPIDAHLGLKDALDCGPERANGSVIQFSPARERVNCSSSP
jgi:hypothetical protein